MNILLANISNEMEKTFYKRKTLALLLVTAIIPVGTAMLLFLFKSKVGILGLRATDFPVFILGLFTNLFLPLFVFMWAADSFAGEAGERTLKLTFLKCESGDGSLTHAGKCTKGVSRGRTKSLRDGLG